MFILLFSGRILINGPWMVWWQCICNLRWFLFYFLKKYNFKKSKNSRLFFITSGICLGIILSLLKNEGFVLILLIFITTIF